MSKRPDETLLAQVVDMGRAGGVPGEVLEAAFEEVLRGEGAERLVIGDDARQLYPRAGDRQVDDGLLAPLERLDPVQLVLSSAQGDECAVDAVESAFGQPVLEDDGPGVFAGVGEDRLQPRQAERIERDEDGLRLHAAIIPYVGRIVQF